MCEVSKNEKSPTYSIHCFEGWCENLGHFIEDVLFAPNSQRGTQNSGAFIFICVFI